MKLISEEQLKQYRENGYLIVKNFIDKEHVKSMMDFVAYVIALEGESIIKERELTKQEILNDSLIEIKRKNPSSSSWIYQTILTSYALKEFFINIDIARVVMQLLGIEDKNNLGIISPSFRFDIPSDTRNVRKWHQDSNYFLENDKGEEHLVVWIPMNKATKDNGSVIIAPKTHRDGRIEPIYEAAEPYKSEQYVSQDKYFKNVEPEYIEADEGDIAFINMDLFHSSGVNVTENEVRYTAQIRMNTINKPDYRPVFLKPEYPTYNRMN